MLLKNNRLSGSKLYLILDTQVAPYEKLLRLVRKVVPAGVDIIQLRDKFGLPRDMIRFSQAINRFTKGVVPYIINDRIDVALAVDCAGAHIGQEDLPCPEARRILGDKKLIGVSCQTVAQCRQAEKDGADYIGFGSVFPTLTKPGRPPMDLRMLTQAVAAVRIPVFPIGGIKIENRGKLQNLGIERLAVCRAVLESPRPAETVKILRG
ncbi:MAG: thiamine phosphate synthase [Candidatus Omnitrophica bacterium]|nr:thiamine phosphate synthase [Candidatus Omnitrophota bacterium]